MRFNSHNVSFKFALGNNISDNIFSIHGKVFYYYQCMLEYVDYHKIIIECLAYLDILLNKYYSVRQNAY